jgi:Fe-S cluster assembly ATP-binding protein
MNDNTTPILEVQNLVVTVEGKEAPVLNNVSLRVNKGEKHVIMGPYGAGKSTLSKVIMGHPSYEVVQGDILLNGESIIDDEIDERALKGLFMSLQYPPEVEGVSMKTFLHLTYNAHLKSKSLPTITMEEYLKLVSKQFESMDIPLSFLDRNINEGFSGGEKKRNEIIQMLMLDPVCSVLDETDSGLDIDALKTVSDGINTSLNTDNCVLLITHYQRLLEYVKPDYVHVMIDGQIVESGGPELALKLEKNGYKQCLTQ